MKEASRRKSSDENSGLLTHVKRFKIDVDNNHSEDSIEWDFELSEIEGFVNEDGKLLTSLVRRTYIHHLQKSLMHNYDSWFKSYGDGVELSESVIVRCAAQIEKKALRACMLASLYQHSIIKLIKNIKKSTAHKKLFEDLLSSLNCSKRCDKSIQTEEICHSPLQNVSVVSPKLADTCKSSSPLKSTTLNILNTSSLVTGRSYLESPQPVPSPITVPNAPVAPKFVISYLPKTESMKENRSLLSELCDNDGVINKIYDPEFNPSLEDRIVHSEEKRSLKRFGQANEKNTSSKTSYSLKKRKSNFETSSQQTLEERLKKFEEIFGDACEDVPPDPKPPDKQPQVNYTKFFTLVSWKQESIAQTCELNKKLLLMPPSCLKSIEIQLKRLFGSNDPLTEITPEQFTHCRKRLANIIVSQLTPYFDLGQIGSRIVFKALAREITRIILIDTYAADMQYTQKVVDEIFQNETKYKTLDDVNVLCSR